MAGAYPGFMSMKHLGLLQPPPPPLEGMLVHRRVTSQRREIEFKACKDTARRKRDFLPHSIFPILS